MQKIGEAPKRGRRCLGGDMLVAFMSESVTRYSSKAAKLTLISELGSKAFFYFNQAYSRLKVGCDSDSNKLSFL